MRRKTALDGAIVRNIKRSREGAALYSWQRRRQHRAARKIISSLARSNNAGMARCISAAAAAGALANPARA
jgi:hypothetical protein